LISRIGTAFARFLKPISRGASTGDSAQKEGSNAGFTSWRKPKAETPAPAAPAEPSLVEPMEATPEPAGEGVRPGLQTPPIACLSEEEKERYQQAEGKKKEGPVGMKKRRGSKQGERGSAQESDDDSGFELYKNVPEGTLPKDTPPPQEREQEPEPGVKTT
jgi:hypothetical protein